MQAGYFTWHAKRDTPSGPGTPPLSTNATSAPSAGDREHSAHVPVLEASGELDLAVAPLLSDRLDAILAGGASSAILDLSLATFLDSTALGVLLGLLNRCTALGGHVHLVVTEPQILRVLSITGLSQAFVIHELRPEFVAGGAVS